MNPSRIGRFIEKIEKFFNMHDINFSSRTGLPFSDDHLFTIEFSGTTWLLPGLGCRRGLDLGDYGTRRCIWLDHGAVSKGGEFGCSEVWPGSTNTWVVKFVQFTLVGWVNIGDEILFNYMEDYFISQYKDQYEPISIMECHKGFLTCHHQMSLVPIVNWSSNEASRSFGLIDW